MNTENHSDALPTRRADDRHPFTMKLMWDLISGRLWMLGDLVLALLDWTLVLILGAALISVVVLSVYVLLMYFAA